MENEDQRDLLFLRAISEDTNVTQRDLSKRLDVALGLTNLYLKKLASRGFIKIINIKPNRLRYLLTPKGIAEKSRLTYTYVSYSLRMYREARESLRGALSYLAEDGSKRIVFYGTGEAAEVAYLCLKESGLEVAAVYDKKAGGEFLGLPIQPLEHVDAGGFDRIVITAFAGVEGTQARIEDLITLGVPQEKIVTLRRWGPPILEGAEGYRAGTGAAQGGVIDG